MCLFRAEHPKETSQAIKTASCSLQRDEEGAASSFQGRRFANTAFLGTEVKAQAPGMATTQR